jgi:hypothetical protein
MYSNRRMSNRYDCLPASRNEMELQYITKEEIYTVLALVTLMGVVQKPSLTPFLMNQLVIRPSILSLSWIDMKSSAEYYIL